MRTVMASDLQALVSHRDGWCISLYLPMHPTGRDGQQDKVRLKNLIAAVEEQLIAKGMRTVAARELLAPVRQLPHDHLAWQHRGRGLAVFRSDGTFRQYWLTTPLAEAAVVDQRFHVKHLLPAVDGNPRFYVLALSRNRVRFLEASLDGFQSLRPAGLPTSIEQALNLQGADRGEQVHSGTRGGLRKEAGVFHGQGGRRDTLKDEVTTYFRQIDSSLRPILCERRDPLILAGVEYELAMFRDASTYSHLSDQALHGGFDHVDDRALYEQVLPVARQIFNGGRQQVIAQYGHLANTAKASCDLGKILTAAHQGQIETLLVDHRGELFGRFHPEANSVETVAEREPALDLVELAMAQTIQHRGSVYSVTRDELATASPLRAIFRY